MGKKLLVAIPYMYLFHFTFSGADVIGVNCHFDARRGLETMKIFKKALDEARIKRHLIIQPVGFHTPDADVKGFIHLPEFPFGR